MSDLDELLEREGRRFRSEFYKSPDFPMPGSFGRRWRKAPAIAITTAIVVAAALAVILATLTGPGLSQQQEVIPAAPPGLQDPLKVSPNAEVPQSAVAAPTSERTRVPGARVTTEWKLVAIGKSGHRIAFDYVIGNGCDFLDHIQVDQTDSSVRIAPIIASDMKRGTVCAASRTIGQAYVDLRKPLDSRPLFHAPVTNGYTFNG